MLGATVFPMSASATPRSEVVARAVEVKEQIDALDERTEILAEEYNASNERHAKLVSQARDAARQVRETSKRTSEVQSQLTVRAESMYRDGPMGFAEVLFGTTSFEAFATAWDFLRELNEDDAQLVETLKRARAQQARAQRLLERKERQAAKESQRLAVQKNAIKAEIAARRRMLTGLEAEVAALDRAEEQRRAREASRVAALAVRIAPSPVARAFPPPTQAARSEVVQVAKRYLGAPYVWGAEGPNSFDCSGFTSFVYRQVGVDLPRVSRDQIGAGQPVSRQDLEAGDLVFFGNPIHHVGIYVGDGMMIHSPRTGDVVRISPYTMTTWAPAAPRSRLDTALSRDPSAAASQV